MSCFSLKNPNQAVKNAQKWIKTNNKNENKDKNKNKNSQSTAGSSSTCY